MFKRGPYLFMKIILIIASLLLTGCTSMNEGGNPINRSILFDTNFSFGVDNLPIVLPKINLGIGFHVRRLSPKEEIELELAKKGRYQGDVVPKFEIPPVGPAPIKLEK